MPNHALPRVLAVAVLFIAWAGVSAPGQVRRPPLATQSFEDSGPQPDWFVCGTLDARKRQALRRRPLALEHGAPLFFRQRPAVIRADHTGTIHFENFTVVGDVATLEFRPYDPFSEDPRVEFWERTGTRMVGERMVSLFNPTWPAAELARLMRIQTHGYDDPSLLWGRVVSNGATSGIYVRVASTNLPVSKVTRVDNTVQFASHVVNLVLPNYGDSRIAGGTYAFEEERVTRELYRHVRDTYDAVAIVPQLTHVAPFDGFHFNVQNDVHGISKPILDDSAYYGSAGRLKGIEVYPQVALAMNDASNHEIAHQWGHSYDWHAMTGITLAGHRPDAHTPLLAEEETLVGALLDGTRRIRATADGGFVVERTPLPIRFHSLLMYGMGLIPAERVPDVNVFHDQAQFLDTVGSTPTPGTVVVGGSTQVGIDQILMQHGPRIGSVARVWRRATVVVSRDSLISPREMDYWNFIAQRLEDPEGSGVPSYNGFVSFDAATRWAADLQTDIDPLGSAQK